MNTTTTAPQVFRSCQMIGCLLFRVLTQGLFTTCRFHLCDAHLLTFLSKSWEMWKQKIYDTEIQILLPLSVIAQNLPATFSHIICEVCYLLMKGNYLRQKGLLSPKGADAHCNFACKLTFTRAKLRSALLCFSVGNIFLGNWIKSLA